jgi:hypothetical protein
VPLRVLRTTPFGALTADDVLELINYVFINVRLRLIIQDPTPRIRLFTLGAHRKCLSNGVSVLSR